MNLAEATRLLMDLGLPSGDHAVFGSGPLLVREIIAEVNDIDMISRGRAWIQAGTTGDLVYLPHHDVTVASFFGGKITVGCCWAIGDVDIDDAIDTAALIDGIPYAELSVVAKYKGIAARPKDIEHLRRLQIWLDSGGDRGFTSLDG